MENVIINSKFEFPVLIQRTLLCITLILCLILSRTVKADDTIRFNGFISQGFIYTDNNNFYGDSESGTFEFSEVGFNVSKRFSPKLRLSSQIISRITGQEVDGDLDLDYLFLEYKAPVSSSSQLGLRVGRVKNLLGFYNETRDVAFGRPSIFAPQTIYFDAVRDFQLSSDGFIGYGEFRANHGTILLEAGAGHARTDSDTESALLGNDFDGNFHNEKINQARISYALNDQSWSFALSSVNAELNYRSGINTPFSSGKIDMDFDVISIDYAGELFLITSEFMFLDMDFDLQPLFTNTRPSKSWYLQVQYLLNTNWSIYVRNEGFYLDKKDKKGERFSMETGQPNHLVFAKHTSFGLKWLPNYNWMLVMEVQDINGTATLDRQNNPNPFATKKDWRLFSVMLSYRF